MKNRCIPLCLLLLTHLMSAQTDTVFISNTESMEAMTPTVLTAARNEIFKMQDPCRFLLKFNLVPIIPSNLTGILAYDDIDNYSLEEAVQLQISGEFKLNASMSIDAGIQTTHNSSDWFTSVTTRVEPRWYYGMSRKIKNGTQADNLSGNYLSIEYAHVRDRYETFERTNTLLFNWGVQRRLFNRGYFDLGFGAGVAFTKSSPYSRGGRAFLARPRLAVGLAVARPKSDKHAGGYCEVLRCFVEDRRMWKLDLYNLVDFYTDDRFRTVTLAPTIAYEQKIAASAWSVHTEIGGLYYHSRYITGTGERKQYIQTYQAAIAVQPRWYFTLKRRISQGRSGNSLSGIYLGLHSRWAYNHQPPIDFIQFESDDRYTQYWTWAPVIGWQYRFMRNGYADFFLGPGWGFQQYATSKANGVRSAWKKQEQGYVVGGLRVGLAF